MFRPSARPQWSTKRISGSLRPGSTILVAIAGFCCSSAADGLRRDPPSDRRGGHCWPRRDWRRISIPPRRMAPPSIVFLLVLCRWRLSRWLPDPMTAHFSATARAIVASCAAAVGVPLVPLAAVPGSHHNRCGRRCFQSGQPFAPPFPAAVGTKTSVTMSFMLRSLPLV